MGELEEVFPKTGLAAFLSKVGGCLCLLDQESLGGRRARKSRQVRRLWGRDPSTVAAAPGAGGIDLSFFGVEKMGCSTIVYIT